MQWSSSFLNDFVSPGFTEISSVEIPDLRAEFTQASHWLVNHFLNSVLRARFSHRIRQLALGFLRRATSAFAAYHRARELTLSFMEARRNGTQPIRLYYSAVDAWEEFVLQSAMALDLFRHLNGGQGVFQKNDGSPEERLYTIGNQIKHTASCVASGQCSEKETLPLWLSDAGLESFGRSLTYGEAASVLADISKLADELQDPASFR